jgi:hypothetical protein
MQKEKKPPFTASGGNKNKSGQSPRKQQQKTGCKSSDFNKNVQLSNQKQRLRNRKAAFPTN